MASVNANERLNTFPPGTLNKTIVSDLANEVSNHKDDIIWLSQNTKFFNFITHDNITLQAYDIGLSSNKNRDILLFFAGYTETTIKYMKYLKFMNSLGFRIFSFDLRGQGFSGLTEGVIIYI